MNSVMRNAVTSFIAVLSLVRSMVLNTRKTAISIYLMSGFSKYDELLSKLGKHKLGKSCLYVKKLSDIDMEILKELIVASLDYMKVKYPE